MKGVVAGMLAGWSITGAFAQGVLETPDPTTMYTGIGVVSGWHCSARRIELAIDSYPRIVAPSGSDRQDTRGVCGHADTGFAYTINYNNLSSGPHRIVAYADGVEFARSFFVTVNLTALGGANATLDNARNYIYEFPRRGLKTELIWSEATQNFGVNVVTENPPPLARARGRNTGMARLSTPTAQGSGESCLFPAPTYSDASVEADISIESGRASLSLRFATGRACTVSGEVLQTSYGTGELRFATSDCFDLLQPTLLDVSFTDAATTNAAVALQPGVQYPVEFRVTARKFGASLGNPLSSCGVSQFMSVMLWPTPR